MKHRWTGLVAIGFAVGAFAADAAAADPPAIDGTTAAGDRVRLYPNGRWEYVEVAKAAAQRPVVDAYDAKKAEEIAQEQGGLFGLGRKVKPGDADYNRGSLGGKSR